MVVSAKQNLKLGSCHHRLSNFVRLCFTAADHHLWTEDAYPDDSATEKVSFLSELMIIVARSINHEVLVERVNADSEWFQLLSKAVSSFLFS